jgi:malonyl-CoA reductase/3-hydroxypropionate dehydrogenase (NADP+)
MMSGARVVLAFRSLESLGYARSVSAIARHGLDAPAAPRAPAPRVGGPLLRLHPRPLRRLDGIIVLPRYGNGQHGYSLSTAGDDDVEAFVRDRDRLAGRLRRGAGDQPGPLGLPQGSAGTHLRHQSQRRSRQLFNDIKRAAVEALIRIWRHEDGRCAARASATGPSCPTSWCATTTTRATTSPSPRTGRRR